MDYTADPLPPEQEVRCPECGALIGLRVTVGQRAYIQAGHLLIAHAGGYCAVCSNRLHWSNGQAKLDQLIRDTRENREKMLTAAERVELERVAEGGE